jgi:tRNA N6-adenosine threonylcarbamoyltransferase
LVKENEKWKEDPLRPDLCASFQETVVNMLWSTTLKAAQHLRPRSILLSGGVAANSRLREFFAEQSAAAGFKFYYPKPILTTDNAAMIAAAGTAKLMRGETVDVTANADPNLRLAVSDRNLSSKRWKT